MRRGGDAEDSHRGTLNVDIPKLRDGRTGVSAMEVRAQATRGDMTGFAVSLSFDGGIVTIGSELSSQSDLEDSGHVSTFMIVKAPNAWL